MSHTLSIRMLPQRAHCCEDVVISQPGIQRRLPCGNLHDESLLKRLQNIQDTLRPRAPTNFSSKVSLQQSSSGCLFPPPGDSSRWWVTRTCSRPRVIRDPLKSGKRGLPHLHALVGANSGPTVISHVKSYGTWTPRPSRIVTAGVHYPFTPPNSQGSRMCYTKSRYTLSLSFSTAYYVLRFIDGRVRAPPQYPRLSLGSPLLHTCLPRCGPYRGSRLGKGDLKRLCEAVQGEDRGEEEPGPIAVGPSSRLCVTDGSCGGEGESAGGIERTPRG